MRKFLQRSAINTNQYLIISISNYVTRNPLFSILFETNLTGSFHGHKKQERIIY